MGVVVIQKRDEVPAEVTQHLAQECHHFILANVVPEEEAKEPEAIARWAHRDARDHRDTVVGEAVADQRGAAHRRPCPLDRRGEQKARFIDEDQVGAQPRAVFFILFQSVTFHFWMAASLRSKARRSGFYGLQSRAWRIRATWVKW